VASGKASLWDYLDAEGQIIRILADGPATAGAIYRDVKFSQPVVSKKFARLQDEGLIVSRRDPNDRRVVWYDLSDDFKANFLSDLGDRDLAQPVDGTKNNEIIRNA
jgi:DNA-binding transcriptional ArsR family regulator